MRAYCGARKAVTADVRRCDCAIGPFSIDGGPCQRCGRTPVVVGAREVDSLCLFKAGHRGRHSFDGQQR